MPRSPSEHPTELELEILKILWDDSPSLVRDVRARLDSQADRSLAHSSVITMLNIMFEKGFLRRRKEGKSFLFWPRVKKENIAVGIVGDVLSRMFDGDPAAMVMNLIDTADLNADEFAEIKKLIAQKAKGQKK